MKESTPHVIDGRTHTYHAEAHAVEATLKIPLQQHVHPQAFVQLHPHGGYLSERATDFKLEEVIRFKSAYTQVSGNLEVKPGGGWHTLATSVVEELNILEIVTADRVVAQITTEHPRKGYVPTISFLGTRFENLRIAGHKVELELDPQMLGPRPQNDAAFTSKEHSGFFGRVIEQHKAILGCKELPDASRERYNGFSAEVENPGKVQCSLVSQASGAFPGAHKGHVIYVPGFGTIYLATLVVTQEDFHNGTPKKTTFDLKMIEVEMGCAGSGSGGVGGVKTNGGTLP
jgi:hypothetical protein